MEIIDARGFDCPQPLLLLQSAMKKNADSYQVLATCGAAKENITRYAEKHGFKVETEQEGNEVKLTLHK